MISALSHVREPDDLAESERIQPPQRRAPRREPGPYVIMDEAYVNLGTYR